MSDDVARARQPEPVRVDRVDMRLRDVVGPHLDVVELGEVRGEQRPDSPTAHDADPHLATAVRSFGSESSRPPVSPLGRTMRTSAITALTTTMRDPDGRSIVLPNSVIPSSISAEHRVEAAHEQCADDRAPQAGRAADHEHRQRDERQVEIDRVDVDRDEVDVQAACEPGQEPRERERREALAVDRDADRASRRGILAGRAKLPPEPASLIGERGDDDKHGPDGRLHEIGGLRHGRRTCSGPGRSSRSSEGCCS